MIAALLFALKLIDTNSHAANVRGVESFAKKKYAEAAKAFAKQKPSAVAAFNEGTAQVAAGNREQGSQTLSKAVGDPKLRSDAFFNRGNSALSSKAYDYAIHDYIEALKANPSDAAAKRNLEIAVAKKLASQQNNKGSAPSPQPQPSPRNAEREKGDPNAEALLRSVQEQEQEELARMHRSKSDRTRVGW